jgi:acyl-[acyl-carrier-protein] desaturase
MATDQFHAKLHQAFTTFFDKAAQERRWNPYRDVPWGAINRDTPEFVATCAETFLGVESFLPDYLRQGLELVRASSWAQRSFAANWGYEELNHSVALMEYLLRSGKRTDKQMADFQAKLMTAEWKRPFDTARRMTIYGSFQEMATFVIYLRHEALAKQHGDDALAAVYRFNARDEIAHAHFYEDVVRVYLEEDREGTVADIAHVAQHFEMPGVGIVPDYDARVELMRAHGHVDRDIFLQKVYFPVLKYLGVTRQELVASAKRERDERRAVASAAQAP